MAVSSNQQASGSGALASGKLETLGPRRIAEEIQELFENGLFAIPVRLSWSQKEESKEGKYPYTYRDVTNPELWGKFINHALAERRDWNGLAVLAGVSRIYVIDIDVAKPGGKRPGIELYEQLVKIHGEPETLTARTGSGGIHLYFKLNSPGLKWKRNFQGVKVGDESYGVDGRGMGGIVFAEPTSYVNGQGELATYQWQNGPPSYDACREMPKFLVDLVNYHAGQRAIASEEEKETTYDTLGASIDVSESSEEAEGPSVELNCPISNGDRPHGRELLLGELSKMLKEAGDSSSMYASALPHGLYGTYYCYRTHGPRRCLFGHMHSGSNNFNLLKRGRVVSYRCHGVECSHKPAKVLGVLDNLKAALQDASSRPVDQHNDMQAITQSTKGSQAVQDLLLKIAIKHAATQAYANLGRLYAYLYMIEGRILATSNETEKSREQLFFVWNGTSWVQDTSNLVASVFVSQMGCLLAWYERQRERFFGTLYTNRPN
jgi:hypothetical protein